jgi:hypothetical protein
MHDDEIAKLWKAFVCYSHYDGESTGWPYPDADKLSAIGRLKRLGGRPQDTGLHRINRDAGGRKGEKGN